MLAPRKKRFHAFGWNKREGFPSQKPGGLYLLLLDTRSCDYRKTKTERVDGKMSRKKFEANNCSFSFKLAQALQQ